jgi:hypothetical protein
VHQHKTFEINALQLNSQFHIIIGPSELSSFDKKMVMWLVELIKEHIDEKFKVPRSMHFSIIPVSNFNFQFHVITGPVTLTI